jgi:hypothetical protein
MHPFVKILTVTLLAVVVCLDGGVSFASQTKGALGIERIGPEQARERVQSGEALLVCSYDEEECKGILLEGALLRSEFESRLASLPRDQEIIFYCG